MIGEPEDLWLVASDAGYGFTVRLKETWAQKKAGKTLLNLPEGALVLPPAPVPGDDALVAVTSEGGKLLVFPVKDVPELPRGKGNKLFDIPAKKFASREDFLTGMTVVAKDRSLIVRSGGRKMTIAWHELKDYRGARAQRGSVLPRGWRTVDVARDRVVGRWSASRDDHGRARHRHTGAAIQAAHGFRRREQLARPRREEHVGEQHQRHDDGHGERNLDEPQRIHRGEVDHGGQQREEEQDGLRVRQREHQAGDERAPAVLALISRRPRPARRARSRVSTPGTADRRRPPT